MTIETGYAIDFEDPNVFTNAAQENIASGDFDTRLQIPTYTTIWTRDGDITCPKCGGGLTLTAIPSHVPLRREISCLENDHTAGHHDWTIYIKAAIRIRK